MSKIYHKTKSNLVPTGKRERSRHRTVLRVENKAQGDPTQIDIFQRNYLYSVNDISDLLFKEPVFHLQSIKV